MGKRRKRRKPIIRRAPRTLPKVFQCPNCGMKTLTVDFDKNTKKAIIKCGTCKLYAELQVPAAHHEVDVYAKFLDLFYEGKLEYTFLEEEEKSEVREESSEKIIE